MNKWDADLETKHVDVLCKHVVVPQIVRLFLASGKEYYYVPIYGFHQSHDGQACQGQ